jgi:hypothetical protein
VADQSRVGTDWNAEELDAIVADYFAMLADELAGRPYVKAHHNAALRERIGRTAGSVERKHMNISAVLIELGLPTINGYKPFSNFQDALGRTIERYLIEHPNALRGDAFVPRWARDVGSQPSQPGLIEPPAIFVDEAPPPPGAPRPPRPAGLERLVRKFDPVARDFRNRSLGKAGEALIVDFERRRLERLDRKDLASKVRWVAEEDGDGAGYDIHSYDRTGNDRLIEVKTTQGARSTPFFVTRNELSLAHERPDHFRLYRLYEVAQGPRLFKLRPPLEKAVTLEAETWRARVG